MNFPKNILLHDKRYFEYEALKERLDLHGFNNISKLELFLWDLEMFLQIQRIMGNTIVLKGGTATQFYLPIKHQRSSVDIDMICSGTKEEIDDTIVQIEKRFNADEQFFRFRPYKPTNPQTSLPLYTYFVNIPSECASRELATSPNKTESGVQEIKMEFLISEQALPVYECSSPQIFAVDTDKTYRILPLDVLLADKLTTLGPNTIGIQNFRGDEQIKQIYDIYSLIDCNIGRIDFNRVKDYYLIRAETEAEARGISFDLSKIHTDVEKQLDELSSIDIPTNTGYKKRINDFQSLYLRRSINRNVSEWAIIGLKLRMVFSLFSEGSEKINEKLTKLNDIEKLLNFETITGPQKGQTIKLFKKEFLGGFGSSCRAPINQLKGKRNHRVFWEVVSRNNIEGVVLWINDFMKTVL